MKAVTAISVPIALMLGLTGLSPLQAQTESKLLTALSSNRSPKSCSINNTQFNFASGWSAVYSTLTNNAAISPDGTKDASSIADNTNNQQHNIYLTAGMPESASVQYAFTCYEKAGTGAFAGIAFATAGFAAGFYANANLSTCAITQTGTYGTGAYVTSSARWISNGWCRVSVTGTFSASTTAFPSISTLPNGTTNPNALYIGTGTGIYIY